MPQAGDIFIYEQFQFKDGSQRDKWFVVLNNSDLENPCLVLKTTSQPRWYGGCIQGCNKKKGCFFAPAVWQTCFIVDTYIQLPQIIEFPASILVKNGLAGRIKFRSPLTTKCFAQLLSCLAGFKEDISELHWNLIYKASN